MSSNIVVGIDFGTTYSGIAWSLNGIKEDIEVVAEWPGGGNRTTPKGYGTGNLSEVLCGVKLLLDETQRTRYTPSIKSKELLDKEGKSPIEAVAAFLKKLVAHSKNVLCRRFGDAAKSMDIQFVLTVPAVWSDKAKHATLAAGLTAGILASHVSLISEPEAAALYCFNSMQAKTVQNGNVAIVCDAGGGTVDLISYAVKNTAPLCLEEATQGTGNYQTNFRFDEDDDEDLEVDYFIPMPGVDDDVSIGLENGFLAIHGATVEGIFGPVVREVETLKQSQIDNVAQAGMKAKVPTCHVFVSVYNCWDLLKPITTTKCVVSGSPLFTKRKNSKGVEYYDIQFILSMTPTFASLVFELGFQGISYGRVRAEY
ncbi:hypothetical protein BBP40_010968 [Aspergillus hancockii]|nr:hypothetical protein BBP40_010968 [Aspergillus hancockii]